MAFKSNQILSVIKFTQADIERRSAHFSVIDGSSCSRIQNGGRILRSYGLFFGFFWIVVMNNGYVVVHGRKNEIFEKMADYWLSVCSSNHTDDLAKSNTRRYEVNLSESL